MSESDVFIYFKNGLVLDFKIESGSDLMDLLHDYKKQLETGANGGQVNKYFVSHGEAKRLIMIDFSTVQLVAINDDGTHQR